MPTGLEAVLMEGSALAPAAAAVSPEEDVVRRIQAGEIEAFDELMLLVEGRVLAVAWRLLGDRDQARDAAQEVYLRLFRSLASYRLGESFKAWLYRIAVNVSLDHLRRRGPAMVSAESLDWEDPGQGQPAEEALLLHERRVLVRQALDLLTPAERSALVLRDLEGLTTEDVARAMGVRAVTIRSQVSSARAKLQVFCARLTHRGGVR